jgi:PAT family beta-lactamase induction signal transducer AmpG
VISLRNSLLVATVLFVSQGSFNYVATLLPIFTVQELGWTDQAYAQYFSVASLVGGIGGMVIGGYLIDRHGKLTMMHLYFALLIVLTVVFVFLKDLWPSSWFIAAFMVIYQLLYVFGCIGIFAIAMECCWQRVSASQFTIFMTIGNLGRITGAKGIGIMKSHFTWEYTILAYAAMVALSWFIMRFLHIRNHLQQVDHLERRHVEQEQPVAANGNAPVA